MGRTLRITLILSLLLAAAATLCANDTPSLEVSVFQDAVVHFTPDEPSRYDSAGVTAEDNGRVMRTDVTFPERPFRCKVTAHLVLKPIPQDEVTVADKWDRAGDIRLCIEGMPDIEVVKFITSYGGLTEYDVDVTDLAPLLIGTRTMKAFIDTWVTPAWKVDFSFTFSADTTVTNADWAEGAMFLASFDREHGDSGGEVVSVNIPDSLSRVKLKYFVSGHCTDGRDADEFVTKDNVISVDGTVVYRFQPWRDDCRTFRPVNPYCRRWSDGWWSCDFDRSGWCPGDIVEPLELDLTDHLTPGQHSIKFMVEDVRPKDDDGNYGYWRMSAYLVGWKK